MKRQQFIKSIGAASLILPSVSFLSFKKSEIDPKMDKDLVQKFVTSCHGKIDVIKDMIEEHPNLLNAAHDWKFGDFETGLGAASHVGNKEIAQFLLDKGAQANIFTAALFGKLDILRPMLSFSPKLINAKGPHGLTLLHHAEKGGEEALEVKEYLISLGLKKLQFPLY